MSPELVDNNQDALLVLSIEGDILQCSRAFLALWGIDHIRNPLRCDADVWPGVMRQLLEPARFFRTLSAVAMEPSRSHTLQLRTRDGRALECHTAPIEHPSRGEQARLWRFRDITQQQQAAEQCRRELNLGGLVRELLPLLRAAVGPGADLRAAIDTQSPPIYADTAGIQRLLLNLVLVAAKAVGRPGGVIEIGVVAVEAPTRLMPPSSQPRLNGIVRLTVADNGVGMSAEEVRAVFETAPRPTTGFGLGPVREIVSEHGGQLSVESRPGAGSTFRVDFPLTGAECCTSTGP